MRNTAVDRYGEDAESGERRGVEVGLYTAHSFQGVDVNAAI